MAFIDRASASGGNGESSSMIFSSRNTKKTVEPLVWESLPCAPSHAHTRLPCRSTATPGSSSATNASTAVQRAQEDIRQANCPVCRASIPQHQLDSALLPSELAQGFPAPGAPRTASDASDGGPLDASLAAFIESVAMVHRKIAAQQKDNQERGTACTS